MVASNLLQLQRRHCFKARNRVHGIERWSRSQVVGAGRGPLVRASLAAAAETGRLVRVYAVEKNPNAVVTLQSLVASEG